MNDALPAIDLDQVRRNSRHAALSTFVGAIFIAASLLFSGWKLHQLNHQVDQLQTEITHKQEDVINLNVKLKRVQEDYNQIKRNLNAIKYSGKEIQAGIQAQYGRLYPEAIKHFDTVLQYDLGNVTAYSCKAHCYYKTANYEKAIEFARVAISKDNKVLQPYCTLCLAYHEQGKTADSVSALKLALSMDVNSYDVIRLDPNFREISSTRAFQQVMDRHLGNIRQIQTGLRSLGFADVKTDGMIGPKTTAAIAKFSSDHSLVREQLSLDDLVTAINQAQAASHQRQAESAMR